MNRAVKGFTLIELLIVVAIIAILAAIAVPNFLEAQTRAKISRVKADHRSVATAIEAYVVDYNRPPVGYYEAELSLNPIWWGMPNTAPANVKDTVARINRMWAQITTPVSYIAAAPEDPFFGKLTSDAFYLTYQRGEYHSFTKWMNDSALLMFKNGAGAKIIQRGYTWSLASCGPNPSQTINYGPRVWFLLSNWIPPNNTAMLIYMPNPQVRNIYDPTNGTVSRGYILRTNKGISTGNND